MTKLARALVLVAPLAAGTSCAQSDEFECPRSSGPIPEHLCEWELFEGEARARRRAPGSSPTR
ncbi:MAG: hypothetical protein HC927_03050 [Deltaproteobacteria bacterium]|nr:hypothetical protein [Deltaproteobacteria bacterium]